MVNRLEPLNLMDFTGGLNLRRNQFQLAENESPDLLNVDIDPRGGFYTRKGWQRWNANDVIDVEAGVAWKPRNCLRPHPRQRQPVHLRRQRPQDLLGRFRRRLLLPDRRDGRRSPPRRRLRAVG